MSEEHLDRAIVVAKNAAWQGFGFDQADLEAGDTDRAYARALIRELLRDMPTIFVYPPARATEAVCNEIRRRAGLEGEG